MFQSPSHPHCPPLLEGVSRAPLRTPYLLIYFLFCFSDEVDLKLTLTSSICSPVLELEQSQSSVTALPRTGLVLGSQLLTLPTDLFLAGTDMGFKPFSPQPLTRTLLFPPHMFNHPAVLRAAGQIRFL